MTAANCAKHIRKHYTPENFDTETLDYDFRSIYKIKGYVKQTELSEVIKIKIFDRDSQIINFVNNCNDSFSILRYKLYKVFRQHNKKDSSSLLFFRLRYGSKLYKQKFTEKCKKCIILPTHPRYKEICASRVQSLKNMIKLYGQDAGTNKWNAFCERNKGNHTLERKIELYGEIVGLKKYNESQQKLKEKNTLSYYIKLYGHTEGTNKYNTRNKNNSSNSVGAPIGSKLYNQIREKQEKLGNWIPWDNLSKYEQYRREVWSYTKLQNLEVMDNFHKRGHQREKGTYAVDHKISIKYGFMNNIPTSIIGNIENLQMLEHSVNSSKCEKCFSYIESNNHLRKVK